MLSVDTSVFNKRDLSIGYFDSSSECSENSSDADTTTSGEVIVVKRSKLSHIIDTSNLIKNIHFQRLYQPMSTDYRHVYPALIFESLTASNTPFLKQVLHQINREDCTLIFNQCSYVRKKMQLTKTSTKTSRNIILEFMTNLAVHIPDVTFRLKQYHLHHVSHIPSSFSEVPFSLLNPKKFEELDNYLIELATERKEMLNPGYIIVGGYHFEGTIMNATDIGIDIPIVGKHSVGGYPRTEFDDVFVFVLDDLGRVLRYESYNLG